MIHEALLLLPSVTSLGWGNFSKQSSMMLKFSTQPWRRLLSTLNYSTVSKPGEEKKFTDTVFLPKTSFPMLKAGNIVKRDDFIQKEAKFLQYYEWQREHISGDEFILLDGPPYANGKTHLGHAINKILKDVTLRSQLVQGRKVHFVPGWDCHGLPVELKALTHVKHKLTTEELRAKARKFAYEASEVQKKSFIKWGVLGDWDKQCYYTYDKSYVAKELQIFFELYKKGLIYQDFKPVYWSPSSKTALAEAELIYNNHESTALTARLETTAGSENDPIYLLVWTTTPWTLPLNDAVCFSKNISYSLIRIPNAPGLYIIAKDLVPGLSAKLQQEIEVLFPVSHNTLMEMKYKHIWRKNELCHVVEGPHVTLSGTGLVHTSFAHGHDDFKIGLKLGAKLICHVDENGCYNHSLGPDLAGLNVLKEGSKIVAEKISSEVLLSEKYTHSYPYDWRTNKPVIIRASQQWFIDTESMKETALEALSEVSHSGEALKITVQSRPYWCLSRQRKWGVPIPAFFDKNSGKPLISKSTIDHLCKVFESSSPDIWWTGRIEELFPSRACDEFSVRIEDVVRGEDITDIWFDSGVAWAAVLNGKQSDICIEGADQFSGWFQTMLLTSAAANGKAPYKKILTHGFAVDSKGGKMSKSLGNVIDPDTIVDGKKALGVDALRWWVAAHSFKTLVPASYSLIEENGRSVQQIRVILKFLLGSLADVTREELKSYKELSYLDRYLLNKCFDFYSSVMNDYNENAYNAVCIKILNFVSREVSSLYASSIKHVLYCDGLDSEERLGIRYVLQGIFNTLTHCIAPILPHLAEEAHIHHPFYSSEKKLLFYNEEMWSPPKFWKDDSSIKIIELALELKEILNKQCAGNSQTLDCTLQAKETDIELLKLMQGGEEYSTNSELTALLQVASISLKKGEKNVFFSETEKTKCPRCRRYSITDDSQVCLFCEGVLARINN